MNPDFKTFKCRGCGILVMSHITIAGNECTNCRYKVIKVSHGDVSYFKMKPSEKVMLIGGILLVGLLWVGLYFTS